MRSQTPQDVEVRELHDDRDPGLAAAYVVGLGTALVLVVLPKRTRVVNYLHFSAFVSACSVYASPGRSPYANSLPLGIVSIFVMSFMSYFLQRFRLKWVMLGGQMLVLAGTILLVFGGSAAHYWPFAFPGFCLGTAGTTIVYGTTK